MRSFLSVSWMQQVQDFCGTLLLGILVGLFVHFYWLLLKKVRPGRALLTLTDLLFCVFLLLMSCGALLVINAAELRFYVWLALLFGGWLYKRFLFGLLTPALSFLAEGLLRGCGFFLRIVCAPIGIFWRHLHRLWKSLWIKGKTSAEIPSEDLE